MTVILARNPSLRVLNYIMVRLREDDLREARATHPSDSPLDWASMLFQAGDFQWVAWHDGEPVASVGAMLRWPGVWSAWCLGTDKFPKVALSVTKHITRVMLPAVRAAGMHRADCFCLADYDKARRWLERMGAREEATLAKWGKNGETFVSYVWLRDEV